MNKIGSGRQPHCNVNLKTRVKVDLRVVLEVIPDNWTQKFEPDGGQISKP